MLFVVFIRKKLLEGWKKDEFKRKILMMDYLHKEFKFLMILKCLLKVYMSLLEVKVMRF